MTDLTCAKLDTFIADLLREEGQISNLEVHLSSFGAYDGIVVTKSSSGFVILSIPDKREQCTRRFKIAAVELPTPTRDTF